MNNIIDFENILKELKGSLSEIQGAYEGCKLNDVLRAFYLHETGLTTLNSDLAEEFRNCVDSAEFLKPELKLALIEGKYYVREALGYALDTSKRYIDPSVNIEDLADRILDKMSELVNDRSKIIPFLQIDDTNIIQKPIFEI